MALDRARRVGAFTHTEFSLGTPTPTLPRKRERERTSDVVAAQPSLNPLYAIPSEAHVRGPMMPSGTRPWSR
jgi:hypothetical protein